jgi:hypothetical protein
LISFDCFGRPAAGVEERLCVACVVLEVPIVTKSIYTLMDCSEDGQLSLLTDVRGLGSSPGLVSRLVRPAGLEETLRGLARRWGFVSVSV